MPAAVRVSRKKVIKERHAMWVPRTQICHDVVNKLNSLGGEVKIVCMRRPPLGHEAGQLSQIQSCINMITWCKSCASLTRNRPLSFVEA